MLNCGYALHTWESIKILYSQVPPTFLPSASLTVLMTASKTDIIHSNALGEL